MYVTQQWLAHIHAVNNVCILMPLCSPLEMSGAESPTEDEALSTDPANWPSLLTVRSQDRTGFQGTKSGTIWLCFPWKWQWRLELRFAQGSWARAAAAQRVRIMLYSTFKTCLIKSVTLFETCHINHTFLQTVSFFIYWIWKLLNIPFTPVNSLMYIAC